MKQQHDACVLPMRIRYCRCFLYLPAPAQSVFFSFKFCLLSAFLLYSIRMLANLCKRPTITTNALLLIKMACSCLRICWEYAFLTEFRNMFLIYAIPLERSESLRTNVWRCTCKHCDLYANQSDNGVSTFSRLFMVQSI